MKVINLKNSVSHKTDVTVDIRWDAFRGAEKSCNGKTALTEY